MSPSFGAIGEFSVGDFGTNKEVITAITSSDLLPPDAKKQSMTL